MGREGKFFFQITASRRTQPAARAMDAGKTLVGFTGDQSGPLANFFYKPLARLDRIVYLITK